MSERPIGYLEPFDGESISHYLGRYRRQPIVSVSSPISLGLATQCGSIYYRWEKLYFNPRLTSEEITLVCSVIGLEEDALIKLLPASNESVRIKPIRFCAACYQEHPWHLMRWQYKSCQGCEHHQVKLLYACPACSQPFPIPAHWSERMKCMRCNFTFSRMWKKQRSWS